MASSATSAVATDANTPPTTDVEEGVSTATNCDSQNDSLPIVDNELKNSYKTNESQEKTSKSMEEVSLHLRYLDVSNEKPVALPDVRTIDNLDQTSIRDMLRKHTGDKSLEIVSIGPLKDMSGMNDAFNSSICSLSCIAAFNRDKASPIAIPLQETDSAGPNIVQKEFNFVVKCPPTSKFIQFAHKFTKPFCNEVSWYIDLVKQLQLTQPSGAEPVLGDTLPECYHAISSYHTLEVNGEGDGGLSKCWYVILIIRK